MTQGADVKTRRFYQLPVPLDITEDDAKELALAQDNVKRHLDGKTVTKVVYVPGRLVNIVTQG